ncbi:MAG TPA: hypothetical protein VJS41_04565 [Stellaceae bacterium]|nr:hypothetical protein [Stellaceae bacterium]
MPITPALSTDSSAGAAMLYISYGEDRETGVAEIHQANTPEGD